MTTAVQEEVHVGSSLISISGPVTVPVTLVQDSTVGFHLNIPIEFLYLSVVEDYDNTITWELDVPDGLNAYFDTPAIAFPGQDTGATLLNKTALQVELQWTNVSQARRGTSFYYTLYVVVNVDGILIPVTHDPTVHNDPPT